MVTLHNSAVWPVPNAYAQPYHPGNGSHGQLFRPCWGSSAWHSPYLVVPLPPQVPSTPLPTPTGLLICYGWAKVLFFISHVWLTHALPTNELGQNYFCWNVYPSFAPPFNFLHPLGFQCMRTRSTFKRSTCTCFCTSFGFDNLRQLFE